MLNGFELYKRYTTIGTTAGRNTPQWEYAQTLNEAFQAVGITRLFDMLEEAEREGKCIELTYQDPAEFTFHLPCGIKLVNRDYLTNTYNQRLPI